MKPLAVRRAKQPNEKFVDAQPAFEPNWKAMHVGQLSVIQSVAVLSRFL